MTKKSQKPKTSDPEVVLVRPSVTPAVLIWLLGLFVVMRKSPAAPAWIAWLGVGLIGGAVAMSLWASLTTYILSSEGLRLRRLFIGGGWSIPLDQIRGIDVRRTWLSRLAASSQVLIQLEARTIRLRGIPSAGRFRDEARRMLARRRPAAVQ